MSDRDRCPWCGAPMVPADDETMICPEDQCVHRHLYGARHAEGM